MWQVQLVLHNFGVDLRPFWGEKNWVDLKAVFPQRGHHNLQAFLQGAGHNRIHLFDPTNAPYPSLPAPAHLLPPISLPAFLHPCLSTSAWQEVGRTPPELQEGWATMSPLQQLAKCRPNKCAVVIQPMVWYEVGSEEGWKAGEVQPCPPMVLGAGIQTNFSVKS